MSDKKIARTRRTKRTRAKILQLGIHRLCVHRSPQHIYAQLIVPGGGNVICSASTVEPELKAKLANGGNITAAAAVGVRIAEKAQKAGIKKVAFDRSGFRYHGRIRALAEAARESGLDF